MLTVGDVLFDGRLVVTDADRFRETLTAGIGSGKAYGFGLLSIARAASPDYSPAGRLPEMMRRKRALSLSNGLPNDPGAVRIRRSAQRNGFMNNPG